LIVLDASAALGFALDDEWDAKAERHLEIVNSDGAAVPAIWLWEFQNALRSAIRRKRMTEAAALGILTRIAKLPIVVEPVGGDVRWSSAFEVAVKTDLSVYDASYLHLALERGLSLLSRNARLNEGAVKLGIATL